MLYLIMLCLQITVLVLADGDTTNATTEEESTIPAVQEPTSEDWVMEPCNCEDDCYPLFLVKVFCHDESWPAFMVSERWVLGAASQLTSSACSVVDANHTNGICSVGLSRYYDTVECKKTIKHEKFKNNNNWRYNLALVKTKGAIPTWTNAPVPWPKRRGFTDECTEFAVYGPRNCTVLKSLKKTDCLTQGSKSLNIKLEIMPLFFCGRLEKSEMKKRQVDDDIHFSPGIAVCNNVVVGIYTTDSSVSKIFLFAKIEEFYTFIHETAKVSVPFQTTPPEEKEVEEEEWNRYGESANTQWSKSSSAESLKKPCLIVFLLMLTPLLIIFFC